jgi:HAD superfamily hydrolase (TIGR01509 family)
VLFDLDDTLFDHARAVRAGLRAVRNEIDPDHARSPAELEARYIALLEQIHPRVVSGRMGPLEARRWRFRRLSAWAGRPVTARGADVLARVYRDVYQRHRHATPGARELLRALRGRHTIGIVTNSLAAEQAEKLERIGLDRLVDFLVTSEEAGVSKPDPAIYRIALRRARARPDEAVMVGDSWENDVLGARSADIAAAWYRPRPILARPTEPFVRIRRFRPTAESLAALRRAHGS